MAKKISSYQAAAQTRERGLLGNITDSLVSGNGSIAGSIGRGISDTFKAKVTGLKEKFDPLNIARKLTGNVGSAILGRATGRSREDMEHFAGPSPRSRGRNAPAHQYTKTGPDLGELSKALHTKVSEGQIPKLRSGDSVSNVLAKIYNLFLITRKVDSDARDVDKEERIKENELKEKRNAELIKALTGTGKAVPVKEKKEEGKSFLEMIGSMISGLIGTIKGMIDKAIELVIAPFKWLLELEWLKGIRDLASVARLAMPFITPLLGPLVAVLLGAAIAYGGKLLLDKMAQFHTGDPNATAESVVVDAAEQIGKKFFGIATTEDKMNEQEFNDAINAATKNNNSIPEEVKQNLLSKDWVKSDPIKVARLNQLTVIPKQNISATERAGQQLPAAGQGTYDIGPVKANASTGEMSVKVNRKRKTTEEPSTTPTVQPVPTTATPMPPEPSPIGERIVAATTNNVDTKLSEDTTPKMINIDNSKKVSTGTSSPSIGLDSSVSVRTDDESLQKLQKQNLRPV